MPRLHAGQADDATGMAQQDRRLGEPRVGKDLLDRHRVGLEVADHFTDAGVDRLEPRLERFPL